MDCRSACNPHRTHFVNVACLAPGFFCPFPPGNIFSRIKVVLRPLLSPVAGSTGHRRGGCFETLLEGSGLNLDDLRLVGDDDCEAFLFSLGERHVGGVL